MFECELSRIASAVIATLTGRFDLHTFIRFGGRRMHILGTDSIEEADAETLRLAPFERWPVIDGMKPKNCDVVSVHETDDGSVGVRFEISSVNKAGAIEKPDERLATPARLLPKGQHEVLVAQAKRLKQREKDPDAGVLLDTDYYVVQPRKLAVEKFWNDALDADKRILSSIMKGT